MEHAVVAINNFIIDTSNFLNVFSSLCEEKLFNVSCKLSELEILLNALQVKCDSIPNTITATAREEYSETIELKEKVLPVEDMIVTGEKSEEITKSNSPDPIETEESLKLGYYTRLIRLGVPKEVVFLKMRDDGIDPQALNIE